MIDQESIERFRRKNNTSEAFIKKIAEIFGSPVIVVQLNPPQPESKEEKPSNSEDEKRSDSHRKHEVNFISMIFKTKIPLSV